MPNRPAYILLIVLLTAYILTACTPPTTEVATPDVPTPDMLADCFQWATALAWQDDNGNGVWDDRERPLAGIEFILSPTVYSRTISDEAGVADIFATTPGGNCFEIVDIQAVRYDGYVLTTPSTVKNVQPDEEYAFGFQPEEASPGAEPNGVTDLFTAGEDGWQFAEPGAVTAVNYLFTWIGEAPPAYEHEQIEAANGRFIHANGADVTEAVGHLLANLHNLTPVNGLRRTNLWTDDYPKWLVDVRLEDGRSLLIYSESTGFRGHAPWYVLVDGQLYLQTSGDIGFALYDLVSEEVQEHFTLEAQPYDEALLEFGASAAIYRDGVNVQGLLPIAPSLTIDLDRNGQTLRGLFILRPRREYETSTIPILGVTEMQLTLPDGTIQPCSISGEKDETYQHTTWSFHCDLTAVPLAKSIAVAISFHTTTEKVLTTTGQIDLGNQ